MEADFWHQKWEKGEIGFHETEGSRLMATHFPGVELEDGARVFVPLCGKSRDIAWLRSQGYQVVGVELSEIAIRQLFKELGLEPAVVKEGALTRFVSPGLDVFVGDVFELTQGLLGRVDLVYDRAALVALPRETRNAYSAHLKKITQLASQFLITFVYDQALKKGPPFSIAEQEVERLYADAFSLTMVDRVEVGFKGQISAQEEVWLLRK